MSRFSPYWIWFALSLPALSMAYDLATSSNPRIYHILVHPSGEYSAILLILALAATPLCLLLKGWRLSTWLKKNRRCLPSSSSMSMLWCGSSPSRRTA